MNLRRNSLFYAAAATTAIPGILHLIFASNVIGSNILSGTFFIIAGVVQIFWALPMIRRWGKIWYYIGIAGTVILIILWTVTRAPNPITEGRALPISEIGIAIEVFQIAYIAITVIILVKERGEKSAQIIKEKR
ncbi:MAG: hypothetical protein ACRD8W_03185 [Nitrososphaeraceae archaeon]